MIRIGLIIVLVAIVGGALSLLAGSRVYQQELSLEQASLVRAVDLHAGVVQDRLSERELLARVTTGLVRSSAAEASSILQPVRASIYAFNSDFVVASWIARLSPGDFDAASQRLTAAGYPLPTLRSFDDSALDLKTVTEPVDVVMDVEPKNKLSMGFPGRVLTEHPILGPALARAIEKMRPVASEPLKLQAAPQQLGVVLLSPLSREGVAGVIGFLSFSYRLAPLMMTNDDLSLFHVALRDVRDGATEFRSDDQGAISTRTTDQNAPVFLRGVDFGDRTWTLAYYPKTEPGLSARRSGLIVAGGGIGLTALIGWLFGYVILNNLRLRREVAARAGVEERLTVVIAELNHRVKNILAVIQSIVTRTMRHGADVDLARDLLIGRIHAMSNVVSLLSDSEWRGVKLRGLIESRAIPHSERITVTGPDITVSARAAQSLSLLFFELASHIDEGYSLVGSHPKVTASWIVEGVGDDARFTFRWEEFNTSDATRRADSDFGLSLLDRVAPEALGGVSKRFFTDASYVYELSAPMKTVIDHTELERTSQIIARKAAKQ